MLSLPKKHHKCPKQKLGVERVNKSAPLVTGWLLPFRSIKIKGCGDYTQFKYKKKLCKRPRIRIRHYTDRDKISL